MDHEVVLYASCADEGTKTRRQGKFVPCKLNNAKTNYNTLDNNELFKFREIEFKPTKILE